MPFENLTFDVPESLTTDDCVLRPIVTADAAKDHDAVLESREFLRVWEQSTWPEDDFTVAANREDMEKLEGRHANRQAFTYTVTDPTGETCLGCVYVMPPDARMFSGARITPVADDQWEEHDAAVYFCVRKSRLEQKTDRALLDALRDWFAREWDFRRILIVTNEQFVQQVDLIESTDLERRFTIEEAGKPVPYIAYA